MDEVENANFCGGCEFERNIICGTRTHECETCGFNPDNGVRERRVEKAMREYRVKLAAGLVYPI